MAATPPKPPQGSLTRYDGSPEEPPPQRYPLVGSWMVIFPQGLPPPVPPSPAQRCSIRTASCGGRKM
ncbi:hypothetical protein E2C01_059954 [Portunus trituberculatus]|uniref:Uncharacterized protein n=1 Tax=Portunus trituberculatus TaxID=210409 RepID=A0A5B7HA21_PORTR|nr:hypothetical protein [Portunus trituberculatus]